VTGTVTGDAKAGDTVTLKVGDNQYTGTVAANGTYSINVPGSALAANASVGASVTATDASGNTFKATADHGYSVDTTVEPPVITNIIDHTGNYSNVTLHGTGEPGQSITLYARDGSTTNGNNTGSWNYGEAVRGITVGADGSWSVNITSLPGTPVNDNEFFKATQTNATGNVSEFSNTVHYWHGSWSNVYTETGDDFAIMGSGNDRIAINSDDANNRLVVDGGIGTDTAAFNMNSSQMASVLLNDSGEIVVTENNGDVNVLRNFETVQFSDGAYKLATGNEHELEGGRGNDTLYGTSGSNELDGEEGNDTLHGFAGDDELEGEEGNDTLYGGSGDDELEGDSGSDKLYGGSGNDELTGGDGQDVFAWTLTDRGAPGNAAVDIITDFHENGSNKDSIDLRNLLEGEEHAQGAGNLLSYLRVSKDGNDTVLHISSKGEFTDSGSISSNEDQTIVLKSANLAVKANGEPASADNVDQTATLLKMLNNGNLNVD
ncbi:MAG: Ig-like domain-containing protein, partial [Gallionella sp.]|nr:Ig-like domain-containing protein [Gallionella sp.]